jgi:hypothetical protein
VSPRAKGYTRLVLGHHGIEKVLFTISKRSQSIQYLDTATGIVSPVHIAPFTLSHVDLTLTVDHACITPVQFAGAFFPSSAFLQVLHRLRRSSSAAQSILQRRNAR